VKRYKIMIDDKRRARKALLEVAQRGEFDVAIILDLDRGIGT
jgi:hypothetical protein